MSILYVPGLAVFEIPGDVSHHIKGRDDGGHDGGAEDEIGRQDVQHGGCCLGAGHEEVVGAFAHHPVDEVGDEHHGPEGGVGFQGGPDGGPHAVDEDHIERSDVDHGMLRPELIIAEPGGAGVGQGRGGQQGEDAAGQDPEVGNVEEGLGFAHQHEAAENGGPAADGDGQMLGRIGHHAGMARHTPVVGHVGNQQQECHDVADAHFELAFTELIIELSG